MKILNNHVLDISAIYTSYTAYAAEDITSISALTGLMQLYNDWLKKGIFNCRNSGYGPNPSDGKADNAGVVCDNTNSKKTFKCRLQWQWPQLFNAYAGAGTITF